MKTDPKFCSAPWAELVAAGAVRHPGGKLPCPACHAFMPPIYFGSCGVCFDCIFSNLLAPRRRNPPRLAPAAAIAVKLTPGQVAALTERQAQVYVRLGAGLTLRAIARADGVSPSAVHKIVCRLRRVNTCLPSPAVGYVPVSISLAATCRRPFLRDQWAVWHTPQQVNQ